MDRAINLHYDTHGQHKEVFDKDIHLVVHPLVPLELVPLHVNMVVQIQAFPYIQVVLDTLDVVHNNVHTVVAAVDILQIVMDENVDEEDVVLDGELNVLNVLNVLNALNELNVLIVLNVQSVEDVNVCVVVLIHCMIVDLWQFAVVLHQKYYCFFSLQL